MDSYRKRWASGKKKRKKTRTFWNSSNFRVAGLFFCHTKWGFFDPLPPSSPSVTWIDPSWRSIFSCFFCGPAEQTLARQMPEDTKIHGYTTNTSRIWAYLSYKCNTNLQIGNQYKLIQFKSPFSSPTSIFLLLRKPLFQELTLTRMGSSWNVEMHRPGCVVQSHLGRAVTEESYKGDLISLHVLTEFNSRLLAEYASQSEILIFFSNTTCMVKWKFTFFQ